MAAFWILILVLFVAAAIPAAIAYGTVRATNAERNNKDRSQFKSFVVFIAKAGSLFVIFGVFVFAWIIGAFEGTNVRFQSSDGEWADSEELFKGRDFEVIMTSFELYRKKCAPQAQLQRTTPRPNWYEYNNWFNDYSSPKWHIPYHPGLPNAINGYYPPVFMNHCANEGYTNEDLHAAHERAIRVISSYAP